MRLPAELRFPEGVKTVEVRAQGRERIIAPADYVWDSFFLGENTVTDDFLTQRADQRQEPREDL